MKLWMDSVIITVIVIIIYLVYIGKFPKLIQKLINFITHKKQKTMDSPILPGEQPQQSQPEQEKQLADAMPPLPSPDENKSVVATTEADKVMTAVGASSGTALDSAYFNVVAHKSNLISAITQVIPDFFSKVEQIVVNDADAVENKIKAEIDNIIAIKDKFKTVFDNISKLL